MLEESLRGPLSLVICEVAERVAIPREEVELSLTVEELLASSTMGAIPAEDALIELELTSRDARCSTISEGTDAGDSSISSLVLSVKPFVPSSAQSISDGSDMAPTVLVAVSISLNILAEVCTTSLRQLPILVDAYVFNRIVVRGIGYRRCYRWYIKTS